MVGNSAFLRIINDGVFSPHLMCELGVDYVDTRFFYTPLSVGLLWIFICWGIFNFWFGNKGCVINSHFKIRFFSLI